MHLLQRYSSPSALFRPLLTRPLLLFTIPFISFSATSCLRCPPSRPHSAGPSSVVFLKPSYSPILSLFPFCQAIDPHCSLLNPFISLIFHTLFSFSLSHWFAHLHLHGLVRDQLNHHIEVPAKTLPVSTRVSRTTTENTRAETNDAACQSYNGERNSDERKRFGKATARPGPLSTPELPGPVGFTGRLRTPHHQPKTWGWGGVHPPGAPVSSTACGPQPRCPLFTLPLSTYLKPGLFVQPPGWIYGQTLMLPFSFILVRATPLPLFKGLTDGLLRFHCAAPPYSS